MPDSHQAAPAGAPATPGTAGPSPRGVRVVVTGATGNVGTSVLEALGADDRVASVLGLARRRPTWHLPKVTWAEADVVSSDLVGLFRGADVVIHLAWAIQPSHRPEVLRAINVVGSARVFDAVGDAGVPSLVYASSIGAYSPGPKDRAVDETWPTEGLVSSFYARHKAAVERRLDLFEHQHPHVRVVRLRKALIFKREAASGVRRLFAGPFVPRWLLRPDRIPAVPDTPGLVFQAVHTSDVADAYRRAALGDARGPFNIAAEPVLDGRRLAEALDARPVRVPRRALRAAASASWRLHLQPTPPGWVDLAFAVPVMDTARARTELGWAPLVGADEALRQLLDGMADGAGLPTPALRPGRSLSPLRRSPPRPRPVGTAG
ncbi:MAG TPA: NAD-dependent epimerase/dehydratase family protein [Acidimicrobiales bacterium]|nr:NAD-dependent epimerase/dehydratase family protein [Acidimicrobiales bacterium]